MSTQIEQLKSIAPFLDPHLLLNFLSKHVPKSDNIQKQIKQQLLSAKQDEAQKMEEQAKSEAINLLNLLNNQELYQKLRQEKSFTLEKLNEDKGINISDCKKLFSYSKILYEQQKYQQCEKYLFSLKEILVQESNTHLEFIQNIFWGLLACQLAQNKEREQFENTTLRKLKELIERLSFEQIHSYQESIKNRAWLVHWIMIYGFTNKNFDIFTSLFTDRVNGNHYLNVVQVQGHYLIRYLIAGLLMENKIQEISDIVVPLIMEEKNLYCDSFTQFVITLFDQFEFDEALKQCANMKKEATDDLLLKSFVNEIEEKAQIVIFQTKCKIHRQICLKEVKDKTKKDKLIDQIQTSMNEEGFETEIDKKNNKLNLKGSKFDAKGRIVAKTSDMIKRTQDLNLHYQNTINQLKGQSQQEAK